MLKNMKIGGKLILVGTLIIAIPLVAVAVVVVTRASRALQQLNDQQLVSRAQEIARTIEGMYSEELKVALTIARDPVVVAAAETSNAPDTTKPPKANGTATERPLGIAATPDAAAFLADITRLDATYESVNLVDMSGNVVSAQAAGGPSPNLGLMTCFKEATAGLDQTLGPWSSARSPGKPVTPVAVPVSSGGKVVGAVILIPRIDFLGNLVAGERVGRTGDVAVVDSAGRRFAHADPGLIMNMNILEMEGDLANDIATVKSGVAHYVFKNVEREAAFAPVKYLLERHPDASLKRVSCPCQGYPGSSDRDCRRCASSDPGALSPFRALHHCSPLPCGGFCASRCLGGLHPAAPDPSAG